MAARKIPVKKLVRKIPAKKNPISNRQEVAKELFPAKSEKQKPRTVVEGVRAYESKPVLVGTFAGKLSYMTRAGCSVEQRDYFVGSVRVGYVRIGDVFELYLYSKNEQQAIRATHFETEKKMHDFLFVEFGL